MTKETFLKAQKLWYQIASRKGVITSLTQRVDKTKCVIKRDEMEKRIHENVLLLANLRKEFEEI